MRLVGIAVRAAIIVVVAGELFANGGTNFVRAAYPLDIGRSEALVTCGQADPGFVRFFADDRDACYARLHVG